MSDYLAVDKFLHIHVVVLLKSEIYRRPFLALARMLLKRDEYVPASMRGKKPEAPELPMTAWDILYREEEGEIKEAQARIRAILGKMGIKEDNLDTMVKVGGEHWMELGADFINPGDIISANC